MFVIEDSEKNRSCGKRIRGVEFIRRAFSTYLEPLYLSRVNDFSAGQAETIRPYRGKDSIAILRDVRTVTVSIVLDTAFVGQPVTLGLSKGNGDEAVIVEELVQEYRADSRGTAGMGKIPTCGGLLRPLVIVSWLTKWHSDLARTGRFIGETARVQQT